jgi:hypothetical protein
MMHQKTPPPDVRLKRPDAPEDLLEICMRMMAKRPAARYQSAQEVADALADWLRARGHSVDSGVGSGSSGRLTLPGSGRFKAASAHEIDSSMARRMSSGVRSGLLVATGDSGVIGATAQAKAAPQPAAGSDATASPAAAKGESGVTGRKPARRESPRNMPAKGALPVAKPLMEADPLAEILADIEAPGGLPATPLLGTTPHGHSASAGTGQLYGRYVASLGSVAKREPKTYRGRHSGAPPWLWPLIIGGCLLAVLLVLLGVLFVL